MSADTADCAIEAKGLEIAYGRRTVLRDVDLRIGAGEAWFLLGANGSGKTSFLRALIGGVVPRSGSLWLHPEHASRTRLGFVPQASRIAPSLPTTVREIVSLGAVNSELTPRERGRALDWALARVGLAGLGERSFWALSGGQRQRALVARALIRRPRWLILDEPTQGLDALTESALLETLAELNRSQRTTLLFVTHHLAVATRHATHIAFFHQGAVVAGPRDEVLTLPELRAGFALEIRS